MKRAILFLGGPVFVTAAVLLSPIIPAPFGFWCGLAAVLLGPGIGIPRLLFPPDALSLPERALMIILSSLFIATAAFAALNALGVMLTPLVVAATLLAPTYLTTLGGGLRWRHYAQADALVAQPDWMYFGGGVVVAAAVSLTALRMLGF